MLPWVAEWSYAIGLPPFSAFKSGSRFSSTLKHKSSPQWIEETVEAVETMELVLPTLYFFPWALRPYGIPLGGVSFGIAANSSGEEERTEPPDPSRQCMGT